MNQVDKIWNIHTREYYVVITKNEVLILATAGQIQKSIMLVESSQMQKTV